MSFPPPASQLDRCNSGQVGSISSFSTHFKNDIAHLCLSPQNVLYILDVKNSLCYRFSFIVEMQLAFCV